MSLDALPMPQQDEHNSAAERATILVVDDAEASRGMLCRRLERYGYRAVGAESGAAALQAIAGGAFDLVLLDVMMPDLSGLEVLEIIRKSAGPADLPVIMATARQDSDYVIAALNLGANDYVTKPLDFAVVFARLRTHLLLKQSVQQAMDLQTSLQARNDQLEIANARLSDFAERAQRELAAAARLQMSFLPPPAAEMLGCQFARIYQPCRELAGDFLNYLQLDRQHVALYLLDVSGHGVAAALLAVAAARILSLSNVAESILLDASADSASPTPALPSDVAARLTRHLAMDQTPEHFITLFYAVLDIQSLELQFVSCGHPPAVRVSRDGSAALLDGSSLPIGVGDDFQTHTAQLSPHDRLYLYSDGITEGMSPERELFGLARAAAALAQTTSLSLGRSMDAALDRAREFSENAPSRDDISLLAMQCP
jgi:phosphoserine phosphatase RsbU/P